jgi:hypothetical protein
MYGTLVINSWVSIHEGCEIKYNLNGSGGTYVTVSGNGDPFEFFFETEALRQFLEVGGTALTELDTLAAQEEAAASPQPAASRDQPAKPPA